MASFNKVILMGNLTRDPEMRYTPSGAAICQLAVATNRQYTTSSGEQREEVCFVDVDVWGKQGENCGQYLRKGRPVLVEGRLRLDQWEDKETGKKRSRLGVTAERVQFIGGRQDDGGQSAGGDGGYSAPQQQYQQPPQHQQPQYQPPQPQYQPPQPQAPPPAATPQAPPSPLPPFPADAPAPANPDAGGASDESIDDIPF